MSEAVSRCHSLGWLLVEGKQTTSVTETCSFAHRDCSVPGAILGVGGKNLSLQPAHTLPNAERKMKNM